MAEIASRLPGAISIGPFGSRMKADRYVSVGVPVIRGGNIGDGRALTGDFVFVADETADELRSSNLFGGELVFPHRGAIGQVALVPRDRPRYMLSTSLMKLTCDPELADPSYLFYYFRSAEGRRALLRNASTVGTPGIGQPLASLRSILVPLPPIGDQRRIAEILGALDDKIELNRRMSETLEATALGLFKSWFVDFDPVRAMAAGRDPGVQSWLASLFPRAFAASELGQIPEGWRIEPVGSLARIVGGTTPRTDEPSFWEGGNHRWATPKDLSRLSSPVLLNTERAITNAGLAQIGSGLLPIGTVLMSSRAPIGYLAILAVPAAINQGFIAMLPTVDASPMFLYFWAKSSQEAIVSRANGSTFLEIGKAGFRPIGVAVPPIKLREAFDDLADPVLERLTAHARESLSLQALRDSLLPRLVAGELDISRI